MNDNSVFIQVDRVDLKLDSYQIAILSQVKPIPDGFILLVKQSSFGDKYALIKVSHKGEIVSIFEKRGNGPGELRSIENIAVAENSIFVSERSAPFVHEYSFDLKLIKDHRIKKGGKLFLLGKYVGIWSLNFNNINDNNKTFILALYDRKTFAFIKVAFEISGVPAFVQRWGGICAIDENQFAGAYTIDYQINVFDSDMNLKKKLISKAPQYIKPYIPWKKSPYNLDKTGIDWMHSWSKIHSIFYVDNKYVLKYLLQKKQYTDIIDKNGKILASELEPKKNRSLIFSQNQFIWQLEWNEDSTKYALIKLKLNHSALK
jgi:hypothetical protein